MSYVDDLLDCMARAEVHLQEFEDASRRGYYTAASFVKLALDGYIRSMKFCLACSKRRANKLEIPPTEFRCAGGCIRPGAYERFRGSNQKLWYVLHWTRLGDKRYDKEGRFLGDDPETKGEET